jgi:hypothetical protein
MSPRTSFAISLAALAVAAPTGAYAATGLTQSASQATVHTNGCQITHNADHSVGVTCPAGRWATLAWAFPLNASLAGPGKVRCLDGACSESPRTAHANGKLYVTQRVHHNTVASVRLG